MNRIEEAKKCKDCVGWHKYCKAECCRSVLIGLNENALITPGKYLSLKLNRVFTASEIWYYSLRGVQHRSGYLKFKKEFIKVVDGQLVYDFPCSKLDGNMCTGHPNNKPKLCRDFLADNCLEKKYYLTPNCLFKYKLEGRNEDDKENKK